MQELDEPRFHFDVETVRNSVTITSKASIEIVTAAFLFSFCSRRVETQFPEALLSSYLLLLKGPGFFFIRSRKALCGAGIFLHPIPP
jgi:hypothetical protein